MNQFRVGLAIALSTLFLWFLASYLMDPCNGFTIDGGLPLDSRIGPELKSLRESGYGLFAPQKGFLCPGEGLSVSDMANASSFVKDEVQLFCASDSLCSGPTPSLQIGPNRLIARTKSIFYFTVCGDSNRNQTPRYCLAFGQTPAETKTTCMSNCLRAA